LLVNFYNDSANFQNDSANHDTLSLGLAAHTAVRRLLASVVANSC